MDEIETCECRPPKSLRDCLSCLRSRNEELERLFTRQHRRSVVADDLWREATGMHDTIPDLGELLEFLMVKAIGQEETTRRIEKAKAEDRVV